MPLLPIALWHRLWFLNNEISKHIHVYMLLPKLKLSYCRQTSSSGPTETLMLCFRASEAGNPPRGKAREQPQRHQGDLGTALTEEHLPGLPHGQRPQSQPHSQAAPAAGPKKAPCLFFPATRPSLAPSGTSLNKQAAASYPIPDVFLALSPSLTIPATTTISPQSRNSWGQGPCSASTSPLDASFGNFGASTCCLLCLCQAQSDLSWPHEHCPSPREIRQWQSNTDASYNNNAGSIYQESTTYVYWATIALCLS